MGMYNDEMKTILVIQVFQLGLRSMLPHFDILYCKKILISLSITIHQYVSAFESNNREVPIN